MFDPHGETSRLSLLAHNSLGLVYNDLFRMLNTRLILRPFQTEDITKVSGIAPRVQVRDFCGHPSHGRLSLSLDRREVSPSPEV